MKTSRSVTPRYLAAVPVVLAVAGLALGLALLSAGSAVPAALGAPGDRVFLPLVLQSNQTTPHTNAEGQGDAGPAQPAALQGGVTRYVATSGIDTFLPAKPNLCSTMAHPCRTIGHAIDMASNGDFVVIYPGTYQEILTVAKSLSFRRWPSVSGEIIVDGNGSGPVFRILSSNTVTIEGLKIQHGAAQYGGGIYVEQGAELNVTNVNVSNNRASLAGGGIYNFGTLTLVNSTVSDNSATSRGGGIFNTGDLILTNSTVISNTSIQHDGGGIYNYTGSTVTLTNSTVSGNSATSSGSGGGIYNDTDSTVTLTNSTVSGNQSGNAGGGIYNVDGTLTLTSSTVISNTSSEYGGGIYNYTGGTVTLTDSTVSGNRSGSEGGGILNSGTLTLTDSTVTGNLSARSGGGIYNAGDLTLTNSTVSDNRAYRFGGGIHNGGDISSSSVLTLTNSTVSNNSADAGGGFFNSGRMTIRNSTISTNSASWAGGIHNETGNIDIQFTTIANNTATASAASVYNTSGMTVTLFATIIAADPLGQSNCAGEGLTSVDPGYNRISDDSCLQPPLDTDKQGVNIELLPLGDYGGPTWTHKPKPTEMVVDIMPRQVCESHFKVWVYPPSTSGARRVPPGAFARRASLSLKTGGSVMQVPSSWGRRHFWSAAPR